MIFVTEKAVPNVVKILTARETERNVVVHKLTFVETDKNFNMDMVKLQAVRKADTILRLLTCWNHRRRHCIHRNCCSRRYLELHLRCWADAHDPTLKQTIKHINSCYLLS